MNANKAYTATIAFRYLRAFADCVFYIFLINVYAQNNNR